MHKNQTVSVESQFTGKVGQFRLSGFFAVIVLLSWLIVVGCSGGGGSGGGGGGAAINDGVFVDSPVAGLNYQTETQAGITDENGTFHYMDGETVRFSIGDVVLGEAPAEPLMTPLHLAGEPFSEVDVDHPVVTNMARFIQSLDADANPGNGIRITEDVMREVSGRPIDFHQSVHEFETDVHVTMMFDTLNGLNMPHNGEEWHLRSAEQARAHMSEHMADWIAGHMGGEPGGNNSGNEGSTGNDGLSDLGPGGTMDPGDGMYPGDGRL